MTSYREVIRSTIAEKHPNVLAPALAAGIADALTEAGFRVVPKQPEPPAPARPTRADTTPPFPARYDENTEYHWARAELVDLIDWAKARISELSADFDGLWGRTLDFTPGLGGGGNEPVSGGRRNENGTAASPTEGEVVAKVGNRNPGQLKTITDDSSPQAQAFHTIAVGLVQLCRPLGRITAARITLAAAQPAGDELEAKPRAGQGECGNPACGWVCTGIGNDRLRKGRCRSCFNYSGVHHGAERPHSVCHETPVPGCKGCMRDELLAEGHHPNDVVSLVDTAAVR